MIEPPIIIGAAAIGGFLMLDARPFVRTLGAGAIAAIAVLPTVAKADQNVLAVDNGSVECTASRSDLTRIALKDDRFVAVSKVGTNDESQDFALEHEPTRGDIYLSVPEGYAKPRLSFFGTTENGYVYRFICTVAGDDAVQLLVANADVERPQDRPVELPDARGLDERAAGLIQAMYEGRPVADFEIDDTPRAAVTAGALKVRLLSHYQGVTFSGRQLQIENASGAPVTLTEEFVGGEGAIAVSLTSTVLQPGDQATAYIVTPDGILRR